MHNENLKKCDATLIYYGQGNRQWIKSKQKELLKSLGLGREKPINPKAILIENEDQLEELLNVDNESMVINTFSPETLEPFLAQLEKYG
jgi:hypothetical protein